MSQSRRTPEGKEMKKRRMRQAIPKCSLCGSVRAYACGVLPVRAVHYCCLLKAMKRRERWEGWCSVAATMVGRIVASDHHHKKKALLYRDVLSQMEPWVCRYRAS
jgi:hypothetical protein